MKKVVSIFIMAMQTDNWGVASLEESIFAEIFAPNYCQHHSNIQSTIFCKMSDAIGKSLITF